MARLCRQLHAGVTPRGHARGMDIHLEKGSKHDYASWRKASGERQPPEQLLCKHDYAITYVQADDRYLRARFDSPGLLGSRVVDDVEFYFTPNDTLVQFRAIRQARLCRAHPGRE